MNPTSKKSLYILLVFLILFSGKISAQSWPAGIHDPSSMIKDGDTYWIFGTGDGIQAKYSKDMVTWTDGPTPFAKGVFPDWILKYAKTSTDQFAGFFWAPDIIYMNNKYYLYYSCSVWGTRNSCIGCVVNKTLNPSSPDYKWEDLGDIGLYSPDFTANGSGWDVNMIDPSMVRGHDNKIWMVYGSFNIGGIMVRQIDSISGKPLTTKASIANSWTGGSNYGEGEGGAMFYKNGYYYLVYNKGGCCNGIASTYYMVIGRSTKPTGPFVDKTYKSMRTTGSTSGGTVFFKHNDSRGQDDRYFGPGHFGLYRENGVDYVSFHYYAPNGYYPSAEANYQGGPTLGLAMLKWGADGWPTISFDFLNEGTYSLINANSSRALDAKNHIPKNTEYIWQLKEDTTYMSQKWIFKALGTGEYTIQNYADTTMYIEAFGDFPRVTNLFTNKITQKFRIVKLSDGKLMIYPSISDKLIDIPNRVIFDYQTKLISYSSGNSNKWTAKIFNAGFTDVKDLTYENPFDVYPNPVADYLTVKIESKCIVNIYNFTGHKIHSQEMDGLNNKINMTNYQKGFYLVEINHNNKKFEQIVIKQ